MTSHQSVNTNYSFRKATNQDSEAIWAILQHAIIRRKEEGSDQWQDGYPNPKTIQNDIHKGAGYVLLSGETIVAYCAILINDEPAYDDIQGEWLTDGDFVLFHRVAIADGHIGKGLSYQLLAHIEAFARRHAIRSVRADTNFDNYAMMRVFERGGFIYCGEVLMRGSPRRAYEKVIA